MKHCCLSFRHASPRLWNELPKKLRQPVDDESLSLSSHLSLTGSSLSSPLSVTMHHSISVPLQTQNLTFSQILPTIVFLTFSDGSRRFLWPFPDLIAHQFLFFFLFLSFLFYTCDRLSWFNQLLNYTLNSCTFFSFPFILALFEVCQCFYWLTLSAVAQLYKRTTQCKHRYIVLVYLY